MDRLYGFSVLSAENVMYLARVYMLSSMLVSPAALCQPQCLSVRSMSIGIDKLAELTAELGASGR